MQDATLRFPCDLSLLCNLREEAFHAERAIRLFQFRSWLLFPTERYYVNAAGFIAAAHYLEHAEDQYFWDDDIGGTFNEHFDTDIDKPPQTIERMNLIKRKYGYRQIFDTFIAKPGGLLTLLKAPSPRKLDKAISFRRQKIPIVSDLIDFRLRCVQHGWRDGNGLSHQDPGLNRALFFCWRPTHDTGGTRGKISTSKSVSVKTMRTWWSSFEDSALLLYLIHKSGIDHFSVTAAATFSISFVEALEREAADATELNRLFGAYARLVDIFQKANSDTFFVKIPETIKKLKLKTKPFSDAERRTMDEYEANYTSMQ